MSGSGVVAFLSLGSNIGDREDYLARAVESLEATERVVAVSTVYETEPVGGVEQDPFLNIVAKIETALAPEALLDCCHEIEQEAKRVREIRWGPRTLDVDILLYGDRRIETATLVVPHPRMTERNFVMAPLLELDPTLIDHPLLDGYDPDSAIGAVTSIGPLPWSRTDT